MGNFADSKIISLLANFFVPEMQKMSFFMFHPNFQQSNAPESSEDIQLQGKTIVWPYKHQSSINHVKMALT